MAGEAMEALQRRRELGEARAEDLLEDGASAGRDQKKSFSSCSPRMNDSKSGATGVMA